jgi:hypothetical protein
LNEAKNRIACTEITKGIVTAEIDFIVMTPDAKVLMMCIDLRTLADRAVSVGLFA